MERRTFIGSSLATVTARRAAAQVAWDYVIVGAGTAGLMAAIFASRRGARVLVLEAAPDVGGTLHLAFGQVSGGGTSLQKAKGIVDSPDRHFDDVMKLSNGFANPDIVRLCVDNAPATLDWLLAAGLTPLDDHPVTGATNSRPGYSTPRYFWGANAGRDILAVVRKEFRPEVNSGRVSLSLNTRATSFIVGASGAVEGVRAVTGGQENEYRGRHVILSTGSYAMNPVMFEELVGGPNYVPAAYPFAQGDGLGMVKAIGGTLRGQELHRVGSGSILTTDKWPAQIYARFNLVPQDRMPWEILVNNAGRRYVREDDTSTNRRELALLKQPKLRYAVVFDDVILNEAPVAVPGWSREKLLSHFDTHSMFHRADTLDELARKAGVDAAGLAETVRDYNASVKSGTDKAFGREHMPRPIAKAPFYAVIHHAHSNTCSTGVTTDAQLRVLRANGQPVPNLYAAGEVLGSGVVLGNAFGPGMLLTPALTFGRVLGEKLPIKA